MLKWSGYDVLTLSEGNALVGAGTLTAEALAEHNAAAAAAAQLSASSGSGSGSGSARKALAWAAMAEVAAYETRSARSGQVRQWFDWRWSDVRMPMV